MLLVNYLKHVRTKMISYLLIFSDSFKTVCFHVFAPVSQPVIPCLTVDINQNVII